jgi:hypothetical protein
MANAVAAGEKPVDSSPRHGRRKKALSHVEDYCHPPHEGDCLPGVFSRLISSTEIEASAPLLGSRPPRSGIRSNSIKEQLEEYKAVQYHTLRPDFGLDFDRKR